MNELPRERDSTLVDAHPTTAIEPMPVWRNLVGLAKDLFPFLTLAVSAIYGFGVKSSTSDRMQQQFQDDHVAIQSVREKVSELGQKESEIAGKVDLLVAEMFRAQRDVK